MFTVYFDTSFYIWLARADDTSAGETLDALDEMAVRAVLSGTIAREFLSSVGRDEQDAKLHARVTLLRQPPNLTAPGLSWDALLLTGDRRREFADALAKLEEPIVRAESAGVLANSEYPHGLRKAATDHTIAQLPFVRENGVDLGAFGDFLAPQLAILGINVPSPLTERELPALHAALIGLLPPGSMEAAATKSRLVSSSVATDGRPYEVILGTASGETRKRLAHTYRDAGGHMAEFVEHAHAIDLLQVDGPQHRQLERDERHELRRLGLRDRCFAASTLDDAVNCVRAASGRPR